MSVPEYPLGPNPLQPSRRPHLIALEPRMMFDAAAAIMIQDAAAADTPSGPVFDAHDTPADHHAVNDAHAPVAAAPAPVSPLAGGDESRDAAPRDAFHVPTSERRDLVSPDGPDRDQAAAPRDMIFIDTAVDDYRQLAAEWAGRGEIVLIDSRSDGIAQMRSALAGQHDIAAIHIVSHGVEGAFWLGTTRIDTDAIQGSLAGSLGEIGRALGSGGDILIYGCDFAEGNDGARALAAFAAATHADVAASTDVTGYAGRGGDWVLEARTGTIEARGLDSADWVHTLDPNTPVPISVTADSLTVTNGAGTVVVTGTTGYGSDARSPDVGAGAVAVWHGAATYQGQSVDLRATVVSISSGDAIRFNRPTGTGVNGDDPTFLLRDLTTANDATVEIRWELVLAGTNTPLPADVRFTIADIDGIGGNPNTRESVTAATAGLAYYTRERNSDINFVSSLDAITASGTQNENTTAGQPLSPQSAATFDWSAVSSFTLSYKLTTNTVTTQAQFYHDGDADFVYTDPVYVSIPRLDLDGNDSTASGNDAHFTFTENGPGVPIVDGDVVVRNPMDINSITGASVRLTNYQAGDTFAIGTLPGNITATVGAVNGGALTITLTGTGSESDYAAAFRAITFHNVSDTPATVQRVIDITFSNDTLTSAVATSRIDVVPVNDPPIAVNDSVSTPEDTVVTFAVLGNDSDPEGDPLTVTAASALHGAVMRNADGTLTYMPSPDFNGADTITYTISDGHGGTSTATVAVTVVPQPDAPVGSVPGAQSLAEDATLIFSAANGNAITVSDADGGLQTVTLAVTHGTLTLGGTNGLTFASGDGTNDTVMTFTGSIAAINAALNGTAYRPDADYYGPAQVSLDVATVPVKGEDFVNGDLEDPRVAAGSNQLVQDSDVPGWKTTASDHEIEVWGTGFRGVTAYHGNQFFEINATQTASLYQDFRSVAGSAISIDFAHRGRAGNDVMQVTAIDLGADGIFGTADDVVLSSRQYTDGNTAWGTYTQAITNAASGDLIRLEFKAVSTATGDTSVGNFIDAVALHQASVATSDHDTIAITVTPVADIAPDSATTAEDTAVSLSPLANDSFENPSRAIVAVDGSAITAGGAAIAVANGTVRLDGAEHLIFTPDANYHGTTSFTYTVASGGATETATDTITVTPVNDAPVATGTPPSRNADDAAIVSYATAGGFTDVDGDTLTYSATGLPAGLTIDAATGVIFGRIDRSASQTAGGQYIVMVTARDPSNASATQSFALTVANPAPIAVNDSVTTAKDTPVTISVLANDSDPDGDPLMVTTASALHGTVTRNADGTLTYSPFANYSGSDTISYTISDGEGGTADATVAVTITRTEQPPVARDDAARTLVDTPVTVAVLANDSDPDGDPLTVTGAVAARGSVTINPDGSLRYVPPAGFAGRDTVTYTIADGQGGTSSATLVVTIGNTAPVATPIPAMLAADGQAISVPLASRFSDADGDALTFTATGLPPGLTIDPATGTITGTIGRSASQGNGGVYDTVLTASDGYGGSVSTTFRWTVSNPSPTARDDGATTAEDSPIIIVVLGNDSDPDGDPLIVVAAAADHGSVTINPDGTITYRPSADFNGTDQIRYTISDDEGGQSSAIVTVNVTPVNDAPRVLPAAPADRSAQDGAALAIDTADWFRDPDGDVLSYSATGLPAGLSIDPSSGIISGTIDRSASQQSGGVYTVAVTARDPGGATATTGFALRVTNPAPVATDDTARTIQRLADQQVPGVDIPVLTNDNDPDHDPLTTIGAVAVNGTASVNADGSIHYVPGPGFAGSDTITYTISDGEGGIATARVFVTVDPLNREPVIAGIGPVSASGGQPITIDVRSGVTDPDGDPVVVTGATTATGVVTINPDGTLNYAAPLGFSGTATISYVVSDGRGGSATGTLIVRVAPAPADIMQLLRIGRVIFQDPMPRLATVQVPGDGEIRNPLSLIETVAQVRTLRSTAIGDRPVGDAVEAIRSLRGTGVDPDTPILAEVARLDTIHDQRDAGDRLFDRRWSDFMVKGLTGFSTAADRGACVMVESVVHDGAIYLEVRDTAEEGGRAPIRSVAIRPSDGSRLPAWIKVDPRGLAIIERPADMDELHLIVRVTRTDGRTTATSIVVQGATGEVELDRRTAHDTSGRAHAAPLHLTLQTPNAAIIAEAQRLTSLFQ